MGYDHRTVGFEKFDGFILALTTMNVMFMVGEQDKEVITNFRHHSHRKLRWAMFHDCELCNDRVMIVEEWISVEDHDCDGEDIVDIVVYPSRGPCPRLVTQIVNKGLGEL